MWANKTGAAHGGYDIGRRIKFENADFDRASRVPGIDRIAGRFFDLKVLET